MEEDPGTPARDRLVGSDRVLSVLMELARRPDGASLDDLARAASSPKPTVHRALASLTRAGLATKTAVGRYSLGDEFLRLAFAFHEARPEHVRVLPALQRLVGRFGETAHYAVLDGGEVVYRAKVDPPSGAVRLSSTIGGRNPAHSTGVGKVLLADALVDDEAVRAWVAEHGLPARTQRTITDPHAFADELARVREQGFAVDDQENEVGVNCVALRLGRGAPVGAVSVSALAYRTPLVDLVEAVPEMRALISGTGDTAA